MPLDVERMLAAEIPDTTYQWDADDVILYHLGVGAGVPPDAASELEYAYEANLKVLPSFATIAMFPSMMAILDLDGFDINPAMILHGEQTIELSGRIPVDASVTNRARVTHVYDKGKGAVVVLEVVSTDASGTVVFTSTPSIYIRGEGGFGGDPGPEPGGMSPAREPDVVVSLPTLPQQALLYRLSGDKNPLHADPGFAAFGGFERPILHGLCSYGIVCKAAVDSLLGGDVAALQTFRARFAGVVYPGETIVVRFWEADGRWILQADTAERNSPVISHASIEVMSGP